ncbi:MAG: putative ATPase [Myxococcota bacterium]|jgi:predicted ATPase
MLEPGARIDRYLAERRLGRGGFAEVWLVRHALLGSRHALKVLHRSSPGLQDRLLEEGRTQAQLDHRNVVPVRDVFPTPVGLGLLMPWVHGPSLRDLLGKHRPTLAEAAALLLGIAHGVEAAHSMGVVHRDLKPDNVLLDLRTGAIVPRVADFGLASHLGSHSSARGGTPAYAAPEQLAGAPVHAAADLWALGVVAVELATGEPALEVASGPWRPLVQGLLQPNPADRMPLDALIAHLEGLIAGAEPLASGAHLSRMADRMAGAEPSPVAALSGAASTLMDAAGPLTNLPAQRTPCLGRAAERVGLDRLLRTARLVTATGPGGAGKTRLAIDAAAARLPELSSGVWFADLTDVHTPEGIARAVAGVLGVRLGGGDPIGRVSDVLRGWGPTLLVLDNCEHVVDPLARALPAWLDAAPALTVLATSRAPLRLSGEHRFSVGPLELPADDTVASILAAPSVALFAARAAEVRPGFTVDADNASVVADIVALVDGLPLAIELAAVRTRTWPLLRLRDRLTNRLGVLSSSARDVSTRHRTLRATLDWSWELLGPSARACLAQLTVFEGGFTAEAAEAVVDLDGAFVDDVLTDLFDNSLVQLREGRFTLLSVVQAYAAEALEDPSAEVRHGAYYAMFGDPDAEEAIRRRGDAGVRKRVAAELTNLVAATRRAVTRGDGEVAVRCAVGGWLTLGMTGPLEEAAALLETVEGCVPPAMRPEFLRKLALARNLLGRGDEALAGLNTALELAADPFTEARVRTTLGTLAWARRDLDEAGRQLVESIRLQGDDPRGALARGNLGLLRKEQGDLDEAEALMASALAVHVACGARVTAATVRTNQAVLWIARGTGPLAVEAAADALRLHREVGDRQGEAVAIGNLGLARVANGEEGLADLAEGVTRSRRLALRRFQTLWTARLALLEVLLRAPATAAQTLADARALAEHRIPGLDAHCLLVEAFAHLRDGDLDAAGARVAEALANPAGPTEKALLLSARVALSRGDNARADHFASRVIDRPSTWSFQMVARALQAQARPTQPVEPLLRMLHGRRSVQAEVAVHRAAVVHALAVGDRDGAVRSAAAARAALGALQPHPDSLMAKRLAALDRDVAG